MVLRKPYEFGKYTKVSLISLASRIRIQLESKKGLKYASQ